MELQFDSEEQARDAAQIKILEILSNKQNLNPDKFDEIHQTYKRTINSLEAQIAFNIKSQIENINLTRNFMEDCYQNVAKCENEIAKMNDSYIKDQEFHQEMEQFEKLCFYRKNIGILLDQLKYFFNVKSQIEKMETMFSQGEQHYESIHYKLMALTDIRDNVIETIQKDYRNSSKEMQIIVQEFSCLSEFEKKFYSTIFKHLENTLELSIKNAAFLILILQICEAGDKILVGKNKEPTYKLRAITAIREGINIKFELRLKDYKEAIMVLENSKFTAGDLLLVLDHTVKCFPKHYQIFELFEEQYRMNIEKRILPFLEDEKQVTESYGTLISMLNWVDSYEALLSRAGLQNDAYVLLRSKVKYYMPFFLEHVQLLIKDYAEKAILRDKQDQQTVTNIMQMIKQKQELISFFPEDLFHFINQQIDFLGPKMSGELFIELLRAICQMINEIQANECKSLVRNLPLTEEGEMSPIYLAALYVNNFYKCMVYSNETKQICLKFSYQELEERVEHIFTAELTKSLNESITQILEKMVKIVYYEINNQLIPKFFTPKWVNEDQMTQVLNTLKDYYADIEILMVNQIYYNKIIKLCFNNLVNCYIEQLILTVRYLQPSIARSN